MTQTLPKFSWISVAILTAILLIFYIFQVTESTKAGFLISNYEKQITDFTQESKVLKNDFSRFNSLINLEIVLGNLNYEKIERIHYLRVPGSQVAAK